MCSHAFEEADALRYENFSELRTFALTDGFQQMSTISRHCMCNVNLLDSVEEALNLARVLADGICEKQNGGLVCGTVV
ncbi:hypothetical protein EWB00_007648 [Schistosoma japonicum]|uniref:Uncharacterized protein n=1 Tax=Schistosoma japonicum TaxID=6182 RepID=A0A4Z2CUD0_SCHJA|nr:hypothetical protein EWB00_007648 [Schistosoma japonicum]